MDIVTKSLGENYLVEKQIGSGTFGTVSIARQNPQHRKRAAGTPARFVAIKTLRSRTEGSPLMLREVNFFAKVPSHPNLILLHEMMLDPESGCVNFVLELMDANLLQWISSRQGRVFSKHSIMTMAVQLLQGLAHIHGHEFVHRDLKPENVLVSRKRTKGSHVNDKISEDFFQKFGGPETNFVMKIADFGLSRPVSDYYDVEGHRWTSYVATRWYRSPEQILSVPLHTPAVDIWSFGCLLVEACTLAPLFPGRDTTHMHELHLQVLGIPSPIAYGGRWAGFLSLSLSGATTKAKGLGGIIYPEYIVSHAEHDIFASAIQSCLQWDPNCRFSAKMLLRKLREVYYCPQYDSTLTVSHRQAVTSKESRCRSVG